MLRRLALVPVLLAVTATVAAAGKGGPSPGAVTGWDGVAAPSGSTRYVALWAGDKTVVAALRVDGGRVLRSNVLRGAYGVPLVAYDGSTGGVSADGTTLILATFAGAPSAATTTRFAVLRTSNLRVREIVELEGSWSYDAISPNGSTLYLVEYLAASQPRYRVRAFDLAAGRLVPGAIVDRREPGPMQGLPVTRATGKDGGWAYTLYAKSGGGEHHFVHALDTRRRVAVCIDLPWHVDQPAVMTVRMGVSPDGKALLLRQPGVGTLASVDTTTFRVRSFRAPVAG